MKKGLLYNISIIGHAESPINVTVIFVPTPQNISKIIQNMAFSHTAHIFSMKVFLFFVFSDGTQPFITIMK